ncbi:MAG: biotin/lipoyl-binding protein [Syntrophales bacterium]|nr:biotin/lipoyl-binding protein [Syntrophales bacterium]
MDYNLKIGGQTLPVEADLKDDGTLLARIGEKSFVTRYQIISENRIHMEVEGIGRNVYIADNGDGKLININGTTYLVQDADALARNGTRKRSSKELPQEITPPMPSVVERIMVAEGDLVEKGQSVIVVSAMKMEATLQAPFKGKVLKINVAEGDKVMPGQILVDIEREEEGESTPQEEITREKEKI